MKSNELKEVLKNFKYFHGFVLDEPIPFKTLFHKEKQQIVLNATVYVKD